MTDAAAHLLPLMPPSLPLPLAMSTGPIDAFYQNFVTALDGAYGEVYPPLLYLWRFFIVVTIAWMGLQWALTESPVAAQGLRRMIYLSTILFVAHEWVPITEAVAGGFSRLGVLAAGGDGLPLTDIDEPSSFGTHSFTTAFRVFDKATSLGSGWQSVLANLPVILLLMISALLIFACGAAVVLMMLVYLLLFKIGAIVVFCLLPFGAFDKTAWVVDRPLGWVMSNGIRFLVLSLVVGMLYRFADQAIQQTFNTVDGTWQDLGDATAVSLELMLVNLLILVFVLMANRFAGEIAGGAASLGLGDFTNRVAGSGTSEPIVRSTAGALTSGAKLAGGAAGLGLLAAGAGAAAAAGVWSKARQRSNLNGGGATAGRSAPQASAASALAVARQPIGGMLRPIPVVARPVTPGDFSVSVGPAGPRRPPSRPPRPLPRGTQRFLPSA